MSHMLPTYVILGQTDYQCSMYEHMQRLLAEAFKLVPNDPVIVKTKTVNCQRL